MKVRLFIFAPTRNFRTATGRGVAIKTLELRGLPQHIRTWRAIFFTWIGIIVTTRGGGGTLRMSSHFRLRIQRQHCLKEGIRPQRTSVGMFKSRRVVRPLVSSYVNNHPLARSIFNRRLRNTDHRSRKVSRQCSGIDGLKQWPSQWS